MYWTQAGAFWQPECGAVFFQGLHCMYSYVYVRDTKQWQSAKEGNLPSHTITIGSTCRLAMGANLSFLLTKDGCNRRAEP